MKRSAVLVFAMALVSLSSAWALWEVPASGVSGKNLGAVTGGDFKKAHEIINQKCVSCHSADRINAAMLSGKNMLQIQQDMEKRGVKLDTNEHEVLGIFWKQTPLKNSK